MGSRVPASMAQAVSVPHESGARCALLDDGRWHFHHGPIELIIGADGTASGVEAALAQAWQRFTQILPELVGELSLLRRPAQSSGTLQGAVANRMLAVTQPYAQHVFVTPMAAVAGAVADELIGFFSSRPGVQRAYLNNGGDIALHVAPGSQYRVGLFSDLARFRGEAIDLDGTFTIDANLPVRGIATSGWRGRSFSLGIADSVTVLAKDAASADVAATLIANQVYVQHVAVQQAPANSLKDDTDLGSRLVTVDVGPLPQTAIDTALEQGAAYARRLCEAGAIHGAVLMLQGSVRAAGLAGFANHATGDVLPLHSNAQQGHESSLNHVKTIKENHV